MLWKGSDVDHVAPMVEAAQARNPDLRAVSFDREICRPANRTRLEDLSESNALPNTGYLSRAEREREQDEAFISMCSQHPAVESAINNLEHRGLPRRTRAHGADGFVRMVALSAVALNLHRIGLLLPEGRAGRRHRRAA